MPHPEGTAVDQLSYTYTARTNRLASVTDAGETDLDWDAKPSTFQYNRVGSMTRMTEALGTGLSRVTDVQVYDERQLPEELHIATHAFPTSDTLFVRYRYDANGQRISKWVSGSGQTERFVRDGMRLVGVFDENNALISWNLGGAAGLVGRAIPDPRIFPPEHVYYVTDHLGSIRAVVNASGTVIEGRDYYPYGLTMPGRFYVEADTTREGFTGHELDKETGDYYAGARYYGSALARWFVVDPMAAKNYFDSPYSYAVNNPLLYVDYTGRDTTLYIQEVAGYELTGPQKNEVLNQVTNIFETNEISMDAVYLPVQESGNMTYPALDQTDVLIQLSPEYGIDFLQNKFSDQIGGDNLLGATVVGSGAGNVNIEIVNDLSIGITHSGLGTIVAHEAIHAMGGVHNTSPTPNLMHDTASASQINSPNQLILPEDRELIQEYLKGD